MHARQRLAVVTSLVLGASLLTPAASGPASASVSPTQRTVSQLEALSKAKLARTGTQSKVDSRLLAEIAMRSGASVASGIKKVQTGVSVSRGQVSVDIRGALTDAVLNRVRAAGGRVQTSVLKAGAARVTLPLDKVLATAALPQVTHIAPAAGAMTASMTRPGAPAEQVRPTKSQRQATIAGNLKSALSGRRAITQALPGGAGSVVSEAVKVHAVDKARNRWGVSGVGVTVGVLSDGVDSLAVSQGTGDLPPGVNVLPGEEGFGDEGTAMLELVHDIAPGASLAFATAFNGEESFADNIRALRAAGADIIVDDAIYFDESPFQDGPIAQAVNDVTADGALYFSSSGNEGNKDDGTSGTFEGDFVSSGQPLPKIVGDMHDFAPGAAVQTSDPVSDFSIGAPVDLFWSDPLGGATTDYDLYIIDENGNIRAFSNDIQSGTQNPYEITFVPFPDHDGQQFSIVVVKYAGDARFLHLDVLRGRFVDQPGPGLTAFSTNGELRGHAATAAAYATAAAPAADPLPFELEPNDPPNPSGPFPGVFTGAQLSERFTSDGPRRVFFNSDGTPITPGNVSSTGGVVRQKPQITAADGVSNSVDGFSPFFGTSAAAPNAAAITALVLSGNPGISPAAVRAAILASALDIEAPGTDPDTGAGIIMANRLLNRTGAIPQPFVVAGDPVVGTSTDGDQFLEPGESATLNIPVTNTGDALARQVRVALSTPTAGVTITPASRAYNRVAKNATKLSPRNWTISLSPSYPLGQAVDLNVVVTFLGGFSPTNAQRSLPTGEPDPVVHDFAYTGPPVPIPDADEAGATVPINVSGIGPLSKATFSVDGTVCTTDEGSTTVGIDHTFVSDLVGFLTSPSGTTIAVFAFADFNGHNFCQAVFDDSADTSIEDVDAEAPFTGSWQPAEPLSSFQGENADGTWQFNVVDFFELDTGSIRSVSLHVSGYIAPGT
jgi:subtilisin-like proprotein convertase family protein